MPQRLAAAILLLALLTITPAPSLAAPQGDTPFGGLPSTQSPFPLPFQAPGSAPAEPTSDAGHRLFFANAQRASLTRPVHTRQRMRAMIRTLQRSGADLGVLIEVQGGQPDQFRRRTRGSWALVTPGVGVRNGVIYNPAAWTPVAQSTIKTFWNSGRNAQIPVVTLRDPQGAEVAVIAVHNPQDNRQLRAVNNRRIMSAVRRFQAAGTPVIIAGDFNEKRSVRCWYTTTQGLSSASHPHAHGCRSGHRGRIDQAFATSGVQFSGYRRTPSAATDHGAVYSVGFTLRAPAG